MQKRIFSITADQGEERISEIEDRNFKIIQLGENKEKKERLYNCMRYVQKDLWIIGVPEEEERERE